MVPGYCVAVNNSRHCRQIQFVGLPERAPSLPEAILFLARPPHPFAGRRDVALHLPFKNTGSKIQAFVFYVIQRDRGPYENHNRNMVSTPPDKENPVAGWTPRDALRAETWAIERSSLVPSHGPCQEPLM